MIKMSYKKKKISHVGCTHAVAHSLLHNLPNNLVLHCSEVKKKRKKKNSQFVVLLARTSLSFGIQELQQILGCLFIVTLMRTNKNNTEMIKYKGAKQTDSAEGGRTRIYADTDICFLYPMMAFSAVGYMQEKKKKKALHVTGTCSVHSFHPYWCRLHARCCCVS